MEQSQNGVESGGFTLEVCSHCSVNGDSPFVFNPNLSQASAGMPFSGISSLTSATGDMSLPTPILSASINGITSPSSTTTITVFDVPATTSAASNDSSQGNSNSQGSNSQGSNSQGTSTTAATTKATTVAPQNLNVVAAGGTSSTTTMPLTVSTKAETFAANPEPASLLLLGSGLLAGVIGRRATRGRRV